MAVLMDISHINMANISANCWQTVEKYEQCRILSYQHYILCLKFLHPHHHHYHHLQIQLQFWFICYGMLQNQSIGMHRILCMKAVQCSNPHLFREWSVVLWLACWTTYSVGIGSNPVRGENFGGNQNGIGIHT